MSSVNFNLHRRGIKLFFLTFVVEGRRPVLSRLVRGEKRPVATPAGEAVRSLWRALHGRYPALTASDYVIMPDHVHLLLIVNFDRDPAFNPLVFVHWFLDESARLVNLALASPCGAPAAVEGPPDFRFPRPRGAGTGSPSFAWQPGFWLALAYDPRHLRAIRHYIALNPARAFWKGDHPDRFLCHRGIDSARLRPLGRRFDGIGNLPLLGSPFLFHVRLTLKKTVAEHEAAIAEIVDRARRGMVPVSGFISPGEKEALRRLKAEPLARFIRLLPGALPERYDPSAEDSREIAAGRLLILSAFPEEPAASFRAACLAMNDLAAAMCRCS